MPKRCLPLVQRLNHLFSGWRLRPQRRLRVCENLQLGDHRFLSVVEFGLQRFLVGGTANSLAMLAVLPGRTDSKDGGAEDVPVWRSVDGELIREARHG